MRLAIAQKSKREDIYQMDAAMIVRISEARVRPGLLDEFRDFIVEGTRHYDELDGFLGDEVLVTDGGLLFISRWRDEVALERFAGSGWRDTPVMLPAQERFLAEPLRVRHFHVVRSR
ncbi:MAG TPA: antibiotic biosynthesis monooxygenase [Polyangiaceae bacterium]|nr:antibiotic biosynthesis monooxygenase [Polyangiaceae bacterium]